MDALTHEQFNTFVTEVWQHPPFPWQSRLAEHVLRTGRWPAVLDVPTGAGKTMALDIALFSLASDPTRAPRRIVFVVDRRVIVSQVAARAESLLERLRDGAAGPIAAEVARRLRRLFGGEFDAAPFSFAELRGGVALDETWAQRPDAALIVASTVDQVGSRLLFRGYGVTPVMRPVHAGLLGNDCLFLLDEVHLARPFAETLRAIQLYHRPASVLPERWAVVQMSATPGSVTEDAFRLGPDDTDPRSALGKRLNARKHARLQVVGKAAEKPEVAVAAAVSALARRIRGQVVGVVVNRVETAARVADALEAQRAGADAVYLLTGRMRPIDRDELWREIRGLVQAGRERVVAGDGRVFVVATQTIEAGADLDFDALVTEIAPVDSLRQRLGRVDRLGELSARGTPAEVVIVAARKQTAPNYQDAVYRDALAATWHALIDRHGKEVFDAGPLSTALPSDSRLLAPAGEAPLLLRSHLDALVQTNPTPAAEPDVALWLHGEQEPAREVGIVWRADIDDEWLVAARKGANALARLDDLRALLAAVPPKSIEAVSVPISSARSWLGRAGGAAASALSDLEQGTPPQDDEPTSQELLALRWAGVNSTVVTPAEIRPGDTLVVPSRRGGLSRGNWRPDATEPVSDLGDRAQWETGQRALLRLDPAVLEPHLPDPVVAGRIPRPNDAELIEPSLVNQAVEELLHELDTSVRAEPDGWLAKVVTELRSGGAPRPRTVPGRAGDPPAQVYLLERRLRRRGRQFLAGLLEPRAAEFDGSDLTNSFTQSEVRLAAHLDGVASVVRQFAASCGLSDEVADDLALAARLHDLGKADPRFQLWLWDGDEIRAAGKAFPSTDAISTDALLAESNRDHRDPARRRAARERSGYPPGMRHELLSVALVTSNEVLAGATDPDLVLHLVASHHGFCRGLPPAQPDPAPRSVTVVHGGKVMEARSDHGLTSLDSALTDRFWRVNHQYGAHMLVWMEALLRLADHRRSAMEAEAS